MLKELLSIFTGNSPLKDITEQFTKMLEIARGMTLEASAVYWDANPSPSRINAIDESDIQVNKLERAIRKKIATHLAVTPAHDVPYSLLLMSLVKDVERLGDYATNLAEASTLVDAPIPDDELTAELRAIRDSVENLAREAGKVFTTSNRERATELTVEGRSVRKRCDELIRRIAKTDYSAGLAVKLTLGVRYYKRIGAHYLNLISGVIMPLHKLDYYDENVVRQQSDDSD